MSHKPSILFVCLGNICRSPTAHGVFEHLLEQQGESASYQVDSAGTAAYHIGKAPDPRSRAAARRRGYDLEDLRARAVEPEDFERFDYILAMDEANLRDLRSLCPRGYRGHLGLFLAFAEGIRVREVPDPYYTSGEQGFEEVLDLVESASKGLLRHLQQATDA
ncbi:low molecular weight protein-tyrosine-phosphatase [Marinobacterium weihaiense]|uniref:protein-tyrosine-phosphatase n=1 Tax=Marinobacterium weihaiense TaxID=2851016 RepID=A0ABS6M786_9GAMM|nr:low molecular weight protein-tyrosine-phosphatase [Marinobacterium weihaiense]MBV0932144.1 low molecular weight phosphotyrosine protein phosphatase [Marinobacterium weihaiense]